MSACFRPAVLGLFVLMFFAVSEKADAISVVSASATTFNTTVPNVTNWSNGWPTSGTTGWDYVGQVNGASGVYLGNGFVLTCGHVGSGTFTLNGATYDLLAGSAQSFGTADLTIFQITSNPGLGSLTLRSSAFPLTNSSIVSIGFGGGQGRTWASAQVSGSNETTQVSGFTTTDFYSLYNSTSNQAQLIGGDSGGADFRYNSATRKWELAGLNEAIGKNNDGTYQASYFVQISTYQSAMLTAAPEPGTALLLALSLSAGWLRRRR